MAMTVILIIIQQIHLYNLIHPLFHPLLPLCYLSSPMIQKLFINVFSYYFCNIQFINTMTDTQKRAPTPAETKYSPLIQYSNGSLYPYWDLKSSGLTPYLNAVRRAFSSINPFSHQQVPTSERIGLGVREGTHYYKDYPYPTSAHFNTKYPSHYDPLKDQRLTIPYGTKVNNVVPQLKVRPTVPRFCEREIRSFKRCALVNGQGLCKEEQNNIIAICPQWALHNLQEKKLAVLKDEALLNKKYRQAMEVGHYNKGRTVSDVPLRSWEDGSRHNLRPDTLWADDRYADVTQQEINAAKQRVKKRRQANPQKKAEIPVYDRTYQVPPREVPLYSV